jgi:hypothetical protein
VSHFVKITPEIKDLGCLRRAVESLGYELKANAICRGWKGITQVCDYVVKLPSGYDVGFNYTGKGYEVVADFFCNYISQHLGTGEENDEQKIGKLLQAYALETAIQKVEQMGGTKIKQVILADGSIEAEFDLPDSGGWGGGW